MFASAISIDKVMTKKVWESIGIPVPEGTTVTADSNMAEIIRLLGKNLIVKPSKEGSSIGLYRINDARLRNLFQRPLRKATEDGMQVMVEELVIGRELTVAVLDKHDGQGLKALPIIEIVALRAIMTTNISTSRMRLSTFALPQSAMMSRDAILAAVEKKQLQSWESKDGQE